MSNFDCESDFRAKCRGDFSGKRVSVIGAARSGMDAAEILRRLGAHVLLSDSQSAAQIGSQRLAQLHRLDVNFVLGATVDMALPTGTELVITSPGVPHLAPVLQAAVEQSIPVWSEIELACRLTNVPLIAITGTNGKTTTTLLIAHILRQAGRNALVAGNISADEIKRTLVSAAWETGTDTEKNEEAAKEAAIKAARAEPDNPKRLVQNELQASNANVPIWEPPVLVAEISSFQLEWVETFAPHIAILTNVTPDHLNRHTSFEEYAQTKARLFAAQTREDWAILNYGNPDSRRIGLALLQQQAQRLVWFTSEAVMPAVEGGAAWIQEGLLNVRLAGGCSVAIMKAVDLPPTLPGAHSLENVLAAASAALALGIAPDLIADAVRSFPGVPHRLEWVRDLGGVRYINNSMCTNVEAAIRSLQAMDRPTIAIMGGADKQLDYTPLVATLHAKAKHVILIGQVADKMEETFRRGNYTPITRADSLDAAVAQAHASALQGETVLLLPACASFDMFRDFEARGLAFRDAVHALTAPANTPN